MKKESCDAVVDQILAHYEHQPSALIAVMQDVQAQYRYLPAEAIEQIAEGLGISVAKAYSVATFYENFSLEAKGKHIIRICDGTAAMSGGQSRFLRRCDVNWAFRKEKDDR